MAEQNGQFVDSLDQAGEEPAGEEPVLQSDDFTQIDGILTKTAERLRNANILTYAQLAAMTPEAIVAALGRSSGVTLKRIVDGNWINRAAELARQKQQTEEALIRQHLASFTVKLLLEEGSQVRKTSVVYVQNGAEDSWPKWNDQRLRQFISETAGVRLEAEADTLPTEAGTSPLTETPPSTVQPAAERQPAAEKQPAEEQTPQTSGPVLIRQVTLFGEMEDWRRALYGGKPFAVETQFDLSEVTQPGGDPLAYLVIVSAKELGRGKRVIIGEARGTWQPGGLVTARVNSRGLPPGTYRLTIDMTSSTSLRPEAAPEVSAVYEGKLFQVFEG